MADPPANPTNRNRSVAQFFAAASVVLSLVFVGYEIRQNTHVARAQARQELAALNQEWLILQATDQDFNDLFSRVWISEEEVSDSELTRAAWTIRLQLRRLENVYFQFTEGLVDESALNSYGLQASSVYQSDRFRDFWVVRDERRACNPRFVEFFEDRMGID